MPPDNPFDLGLPMLRIPEPSRRGRRARRQEPVAPPPAAPAAGDWAEWLDPRPAGPPEPPRPSTSHRIDPTEDDAPVRVPVLIDRSGGNPGPRVRRPRNRNARRGSDRILGVLAMLGVAVVVVSVLLTVIHTGRHKTPAMAASPRATPIPAGVAATTSAAPAPAAIATDDCRSQNTPEVVSGTDPGGTTSGPDAILAFERAYYVQRSGFAARAVVADDAQVPPATQIQRGIDKVPAGTRYCVQITRVPAVDGQYEVRLTQQPPADRASIFTQIITTRSIAGRTLISTISAG
ncbi:hypothetical protein EBN03_16710 [Nocardia stercoris]|uniref:DUF8176 domain-containing protein n=1 Tax=Nocardia stercoris TaxID=2483361 RepID=A0A3M2L534_9NOCA|nr:hypothetical protein EBN03_16710 [Nocardia stercoris]